MKFKLTIFFSLLAVAGFSQFKKGEFLIGGTFSLISQKDKISGLPASENDEAKAKSFSLVPEATYFIKNNTAISFISNINSVKADYPDGSYSSIKLNSFGAGISLYKNFTGGLGIMGRLQGTFGSGNAKTFDAYYQAEDKLKLNATNVSIRPVLYYRFNKKFMIQTVFANVGYDKLTIKYPDDGDYREEVSSFSAGFLDAIQIGASFIF